VACGLVMAMGGSSSSEPMGDSTRVLRDAARSCSCPCMVMRIVTCLRQCSFGCAVWCSLLEGQR